MHILEILALAHLHRTGNLCGDGSEPLLSWISFKMMFKQTSLDWENPQGGTFVKVYQSKWLVCVCVCVTADRCCSSCVRAVATFGQVCLWLRHVSPRNNQLIVQHLHSSATWASQSCSPGPSVATHT